MKEKLHVHTIVKGKVQGVGFRAFTVYHATQKGVDGWVRNLPDGTVELEAEGTKDQLGALLQLLRQGPHLSQVTQIIVDWKTSNRHTQGFTIRRD